MGSITAADSIPPEQMPPREQLINFEMQGHSENTVGQKMPAKVYNSIDQGESRTFESFVYLYFLVSIGFIMAVMYFISPKTQVEYISQHEMNLDVFCSCCILVSIALMSCMLCRQQNPSVVKFTDFPQRYCRPLLICVYLFGITCIVTDAITIWIMIGCIKHQYIRFSFTVLKFLFTIFLVTFLRKYSSAILFNTKITIFHILGTCICLMLRTVFANSRPMMPENLWIFSRECHKNFTNPLLSDEKQYIIAFDQELYMTVIVVLLIIWTNIKTSVNTKSKSKLGSLMYKPGEQNDNSLDTSMESDISRDLSVSRTLKEAVQKEPNVDMGLVLGLTIGSILSIPYTFWWEKSFLTDKRIELLSFHMFLIVSMLLAILLASLKLRNFPIPRMTGISFPVTVLLYVLLFCCTWYSWFSLLGSGIMMKRNRFGTFEIMSFTDNCLFFFQVIFQSYLIIKAFSYCKVTLKPNSSNTIRQCILYLMVCNFVLWIHVVYFDLNHTDKIDLQVSFYGSKLWNIISKSTYPLCMFYRLFSSLCLLETCFLF